MGSQVAAEPIHDLSVFPESLRGKRILLCTESYGPVNGVSRTTMMLVEHLRTHGANVAVVAPQNHTKQNTFIPATRPAPGVHEDHSQRNLEIRIHGWPLPYNQELSVVYPVRLSTLYKKTFGAPPDLIYLASPASLGFQVMLQLRQQPVENQVPIICNFQTDLAGYCEILFPPPFSSLASATFGAVQGFLFQHSSVHTIFYPSRFVRRYLEKQGVQGAKMEVLQRGVKTELFNPIKRSESLRKEIAPGGEIILICVARLAGEKGFEFLAMVAKELNARGLNFKLYIVGGNPNPVVVNDVKAWFLPLTTEGRVIFAGQRTGEDLAAAFASGDIFLHCSITETFGLVVLESMASGVTVVARDEGGPSDIVRDGETGFLVPPADLNAFVDKVILLANDQALRRRFSEAARRQAEEATWDKINNKVAWRMVDIIETREAEQAARQLDGDAASRPKRVGGVVRNAAVLPTTPIFGWMLLNDAVRARIAEARVGGGLAIILGFWFVVGLYLITIKAALWVKAWFRT